MESPLSGQGRAGDFLLSTGDTTALDLLIHNAQVLSEKESYAVRHTPFDQEIAVKCAPEVLVEARARSLQDVRSLHFDGAYVICRNVTLANAVRRALVNLIECTAIDEVKVHHNTGAVPSELLAHRAGLIPIIDGRQEKTPLEGYLLPTSRPRTSQLVFHSPLVSVAHDFCFMDCPGTLALTFKCNRGRGGVHKKYSPCANAPYFPVSALCDPTEEMRAALAQHGLTLDVGTGLIRQVFRKEFVADVLGDVEWRATGTIMVEIVPLGQLTLDEIKAELVRALEHRLETICATLLGDAKC